MAKVRCVFLLSVLLTLAGPPLLAQQTAAPLQSACGLNHDSYLVYPEVGASYVGGTVRGMEQLMHPQPWAARWLLLWVRQYSVGGRVAMRSECLVFVFSPKKSASPGLGTSLPPAPSSPNYQVLRCRDTSKLSKEANQACDDFAGNSRTRKGTAWVIQIPYSQINLLSRAKYTASDLVSISTAYATGAVGLLAALFQAGHETAAGATGGGLGLYYYFALAWPRLRDNYIAIFVRRQQQCNEVSSSSTKEALTSTKESSTSMKKSSTSTKESGGPTTHVINSAEGDDSTKHTESSATEKSGSSSKTSSSARESSRSAELFTCGDVVMFRIPNHHDYYNISMILSAETGYTFVSETAEKSSK
jgi:hypothetical protein